MAIVASAHNAKRAWINAVQNDLQLVATKAEEFNDMRALTWPEQLQLIAQNPNKNHQETQKTGA